MFLTGAKAKRGVPGRGHEPEACGLRMGHPQDKQMWAGLTDQGCLDHSLNSAKLFTPGVDSKAKPAGALAWAMGLQHVMRS